ncbi:MAG: acyl-CoA dehydrogenase C-terminal domain-containing protein, partial [Alphaproteobacteria bacterium]
EREQGRALSGPKAPERPADPILHHPDVRRMLLTGRAYAEGARALAAWIASELDAAQRAPDPRRRASAADFVALMTPVAKALFTDLGSEIANLGVQIYGGHGYIREHGMEQYVRDARITQLYEGTNGIQALDLVGRKLPVDAGRLLRGFFHPVNDFIEANDKDAALAPFVAPLARSFRALQGATAFLAQKGLADPEEAGAAASEYLRLFGLVALAFMWARMAEAAGAKAVAGGDDADFYRAKLGTARFYMARLLPQAGALYAAIAGGGGPILDFAVEDF